MFDKILQISLLFDFYGQLLTDKQQEILQLYYSYDLSLGEISEQLEISRQAVYDTIKRTERILFAYEEKLGLVNRFTKTNHDIESIIKIVDEIQKDRETMKSNPEAILDKITDIKRIASEIIEK